LLQPSGMDATVIRLIAEACDVNPDSVERDRLLVEYGLDSVRAIDLIVALEDAFGLIIADDASRSLRSVDDVIRCIASLKP
jgi:acyl carrier protein